MNKCIILNLVFIITFVNSNNVLDCIKNQSGLKAFTYAYYNVCRLPIDERELVKQYFNELYKSATHDYQENMLLSSVLWCQQFYDDVEKCRKNLMEGGYKITLLRIINETLSTEALKYSYRNTIEDIINTKNDATRQYYKYLFNEYYKILVTKKLRNPIEFCMNVTPIRLPSDYVGVFKETVLNEDKIVQNQERNQNSGEESSRVVNVAVDSDGYAIDLNSPPVNC